MNPFQHTAPVRAGDLVDREDEAAELLRRAVSGQNSRLVAPRRFGKTSLLRRVMADAEDEGWATVYVSFFGVLTVAEVAERVERAYSEQLQGPLASWFRGARRMLRPTLRAGGGPVPASAEVTLAGSEEPALLDRLALPRRIHARDGTRTLVAFDEFQDVLAAGSRVDAVIRSEIEHHGPAASYVFAGSHVGMMRQLFTDKRRAFYAQAVPTELGPLPPDAVAEYIDARFRATGREITTALDAVLAVGAGHPQRTMLLAGAVWDATPPGGVADDGVWDAAITQAMASVRDELRAIWGGLSTSQQRALTTVAYNDRPLYSRGAQAAQGGSRGGGLRAAVAGLLDAGEIVEAPGETTGHRVVDPLLASWIREARAVS